MGNSIAPMTVPGEAFGGTSCAGRKASALSTISGRGEALGAVVPAVWWLIAAVLLQGLLLLSVACNRANDDQGEHGQQETMGKSHPYGVEERGQAPRQGGGCAGRTRGRRWEQDLERAVSLQRDGRLVQRPILAGRWYPARRSALEEALDGYLSGTDTGAEQPARAPLGLVVPHAGYRFSGPVAGRGWATVSGYEYSRVILLAVSHRHPFMGVALPEVDEFSTPIGPVLVDGDARLEVAGAASRRGADDSVRIFQEPFVGEHSLELQLPFLRNTLPDVPVLPVMVGDLDAGQVHDVANILSAAVDRRTLVVVSTDFTHYGRRFQYLPFQAGSLSELRTRLWKLDMGAALLVQALDVDGFDDYLSRTGINICGQNGLRVAMALLGLMEEGGDSLPGTASIINSYDTSLSRGEHPATGSVSYLSISFYAGRGGEEQVVKREARLPAVAKDAGSPERTSQRENADASWGLRGGDLYGYPERYILNPSERDTLVRLARTSLEHHLSGRRAPMVDESLLPPLLNSRLGAYVVLRRDGRIRGSMGRFPGETGDISLYRLVSRMAVAAATEDLRFPPVTIEELPHISMEVSVVGPVQPVQPEQVVVGRDGLLLVKGLNRSVLLPQVPIEHGWSRLQYLEALALSASLPRDGWRGARLYSFYGQVFGR